MKGKVDVVNVSFSFPSRPAVRVLSRLSVTVAAGESLALVGPSGAGKSTVFSLLERLYSPGFGQLTVDDTDISVSEERERKGERFPRSTESGSAMVEAAVGVGSTGCCPLQSHYFRKHFLWL